MRTISIINQKGGSGKTTTAVNLSAALGERMFRVLLIDMDSQSSATKWFRIRDRAKDFHDFLSGDDEQAPPIVKTSAPNVDIIPSSQWLAVTEKLLSQKTRGELALRNRLCTFLECSKYDFVLADCPPSLSLLTINSLIAFKEVLIPVEAHVLSLYGLADLFKNLKIIKDRLNPALKITGILTCRVNKRTQHSYEVAAKLKECFKDLVFKTKVRENINLAEAPSFGLPITIYDTQSKGAEDYRNLAKEIISLQSRSKDYVEEKGTKDYRRKSARGNSIPEIFR